VITITGFGDHNQPEWLIIFTGIRTYRREYDWGDQMHPNDAACAAAARVLAPMLQQILGRL